ncbi:MAG: hypothetical protein AAF581_05960 [Planctomycetota bacterium]
MQPQEARNDLDYINRVIKQTQLRIDPHAFHCVHWGVIVLLWYPLHNLLQDLGHYSWLIALAVAALLLGFGLSAGREILLRRRPRMPGEDTHVVKQVLLIVYSLVFAGSALSALAPMLGLIDGRNVPLIWGLVYANMAFMMGVVYTREFLFSGVAIFGGVILAMIFSEYNGYILGVFMGFGMIVPGVIAERRVRRIVGEHVAEPA